MHDFPIDPPQLPPCPRLPPRSLPHCPAPTWISPRTEDWLVLPDWARNHKSSDVWRLLAPFFNSSFPQIGQKPCFGCVPTGDLNKKGPLFDHTSLKPVFTLLPKRRSVWSKKSSKLSVRKLQLCAFQIQFGRHTKMNETVIRVTQNTAFVVYGL